MIASLQNCRDNTDGDQCDQCLPGYVGNATHGSSNDCTPQSSNQNTCDECDEIGSYGCTDRGCQCKPNVVGERCDQCRSGTYNLAYTNQLGCAECYCSGVSTRCTSSHLYRQPIPINIFSDQFTLTDLQGNAVINGEQLTRNFSENQFNYELANGQDETLYWSLSEQFVGNQILSYGGALRFVLRNAKVSGQYVVDKDVILNGNGVSLFWSRQDSADEINKVNLYESEWQSIERDGPRPASRADLLSVLSNLQSILIRATLYDFVRETSIGDVTLDTATSFEGDEEASAVEKCHCPSGYSGTSCEVCSLYIYRVSHK